MLNFTPMLDFSLVSNLTLVADLNLMWSVPGHWQLLHKMSLDEFGRVYHICLSGLVVEQSSVELEIRVQI